MKDLAYGFLFLILCFVMYLDKGCSYVMNGAGGPETAPVETAPVAPRTARPVRAAKPAPRPKKAKEPASVRQARQAGQCWGPVCYHNPPMPYVPNRL